jgi:hypothetical protein
MTAARETIISRLSGGPAGHTIREGGPVDPARPDECISQCRLSGDIRSHVAATHCDRDLGAHKV